MIFLNYICAHFAKKNRLRLLYTCAHKSGAFALSFGVTLAPIFSQLFQVFEVQVFFTHRHKCTVFESLSFLNLKPSYKIPGFPRFVLKSSILKIKKAEM